MAAIKFRDWTAHSGHPRMAAMSIRITYYLEVISSWCFWAEPAYAELKQRFAGQVEFTWKVALMDASALPVSREQCDWFYRRSGTMVRSPFKLNSGWFDPDLKEYLAPNLVAEAAKDFGVTGDEVRHALAHAALRDGKKVGTWEISAEIAAAAANLSHSDLLTLAKSPGIAGRARASTAEFYALQVSQRPTFVIESSIGDRAVFSGLATAAPLVAAVEAMIDDEAGYASHLAHFGTVPTK